MLAEMPPIVRGVPTLAIDFHAFRPNGLADRASRANLSQDHREGRRTGTWSGNSLLMPEKDTASIDWSHRAAGPIVWLTDGIQSEKSPNGESAAMREGLLRINVLGQF